MTDEVNNEELCEVSDFKFSPWETEQGQNYQTDNNMPVSSTNTHENSMSLKKISNEINHIKSNLDEKFFPDFVFMVNTNFKNTKTQELISINIDKINRARVLLSKLIDDGNYELDLSPNENRDTMIIVATTTTTATTTTRPSFGDIKLIEFSSDEKKPENISKNSLLKIQKKINQDSEAGPSFQINNITTPPQKINTNLSCTNIVAGTSGFTSGKGKPVIISDKLLKKEKLKFENDLNDLGPTGENPIPQQNENITPRLSTNFTGNKSNFNDQDLDENFQDIDGECLEEMKNLKKKIESRFCASTTTAAAGVMQGKRKNLDGNDITPCHSKILRLDKSKKLHISRKLVYDKVNEEANNQPSTSFKNFHIENNNNNNKRRKLNNTHVDYKATFVSKISSSPSTSSSSLAAIKTTDNSHDNLNYQDLILDDYNFDDFQFFEKDEHFNNKIDLNKLSSAIENQKIIINNKKINREKPVMGLYFKLKRDKNTKLIKLKNLCEKNLQPPIKSQSHLVAQKIDPQVDSLTASSYRFNLSYFYQKNHDNSSIGLFLDDSIHLIPNENNFAGLKEFEQSFLASPGIDPSLLPHDGWFENHYKWIVWKLASMDKYNFNNLPKSLTPQSLMNQLIYRYNREIDCSERSAIRKIMEKDSVASRRMVLCVSRILSTALVTDCNNSISELELTDGWYSINTSIDVPLNYYVNTNKIKIGTKLMIYGAQLVNLEEGSYPLDAPSNVKLKISTNSTRRVKWYTKMGFQQQLGPINIKNLNHINPNGGLIGKLVVAVARIYPLVYREKTDDGKIVTRNFRCEEKVNDEFQKKIYKEADKIYDMKLTDDEKYNKIMSLKARDVSPYLKIRITDGITSGIVTIWSNAKECSEIFKENSCIAIYNCQASGMRSNELQLTANGLTTFDQCSKNLLLNIRCSARCLTQISSISSEFSPVYGEFDTIGVVVSIGSASSIGMKGFEIMNVAYRDEKNDDYFMSILFWNGIAEYGYTEIAKIGSVIICKNLERRKNTPPSCIPLSFCTDKTIISCNSRQYSHLHNAFECLIERIGNIKLFVDNSTKKIYNLTKQKSRSIPVSTSTKKNSS